MGAGQSGDAGTESTDGASGVAKARFLTEIRKCENDWEDQQIELLGDSLDMAGSGVVQRKQVEAMVAVLERTLQQCWPEQGDPVVSIAAIRNRPIDFYDQQAKQAAFVGIRVSSDAALAETLRAEIEHGEARLGVGATALLLANLEFPTGTLWANAVLTDLCLDDSQIANQRGQALFHYASLTKWGAIVLAGTTARFQDWVRSFPAGRGIFASLPEARQWAY